MTSSYIPAVKLERRNLEYGGDRGEVVYLLRERRTLTASRRRSMIDMAIEGLIRGLLMNLRCPNRGQYDLIQENPGRIYVFDGLNFVLAIDQRPKEGSLSRLRLEAPSLVVRNFS